MKGRAPIPEFRDFEQTFRELVESKAGGLAAFYAYESQVPRIAQEKARTLRESYGADERTCRYFDLHRTADVHHAPVWEEQLSQVVSTEPKLLGEAVDGADRAASKGEPLLAEGILASRAIND